MATIPSTELVTSFSVLELVELTSFSAASSTPLILPFCGTPDLRSGETSPVLGPIDPEAQKTLRRIDEEMMDPRESLRRHLRDYDPAVLETDGLVKTQVGKFVLPRLAGVCFQ